jgi:magnesium chelatase subunit H
MMQKPTSAVENIGLRVVIVTLDNHLASAAERACTTLQRDIPGLKLGFHAASDWNDETALERCKDDIAEADIIVATMIFIDDQAQAILPALLARRDHCDAMVGVMSAPEITKVTRLGKLNMSGEKNGVMDFLKRLRPAKKPSQKGGEKQMAMLRRLPSILKFIPGPAQDLRSYFLTMQYWLGGSEENLANLIRYLASHYAGDAHAPIRKLKAPLPIEYPQVGVYHQRMRNRVSENASDLPRKSGQLRGTLGLLLMRSYILANNTAHYDCVICALEMRGFRVIPVFSSGLDARPAVEKFFLVDGAPVIDAFVSLTGFSLVGGPAYNDSKSAEDLLAQLDVPYLAAQPLEFQTIEEWEASDSGLSPVEATMMVALPELDGATSPMVFGGRSSLSGNSRDMKAHPERIHSLAARVERLVTLRKTPRAERKVAVVLFNFPPNSGSTGTAAFLSVYASLYNTLVAMKADGYSVDLPESVDALRDRILAGNAARYGAGANVHARVSVEDHVRRERYLAEIEAAWGPAPGRQQTDGSNLFILGERFGNVFVGIQPAFGYEGDPMRLLFERSFAPTHAFCAFYRYIRQTFGAHAVLHFGTHGALEFMPGKQVGMSSGCWPERLIGPLPNVYLYASNNPSEGAIAKRRSAATLVSYLTPSLAQAGLYRGLIDLKSSVERFRTSQPDAIEERTRLAVLIQEQAAAIDLVQAEPAWGDDALTQVAALNDAIIELEYTLIPHGMHVVGEPPLAAERIETLTAMAEDSHGLSHAHDGIELLVNGASVEAAIKAAGLSGDAKTVATFEELARIDGLLAEEHEIPAMLRALDGRFIRPVAGADLLRSAAVLPTGRNMHGFDPYRIPSAFAVADGASQAERVLKRYEADGNAFPESIAIVLWGTDNLKSEGGPIGQALALMGARPRFDSYGRLCGASLMPLEELGRPRVDVVMTLSGIFRDLLPLQTKLLAEAAYLAAAADEAEDKNFIRKHALAYQKQHGCDFETASLRVFSNAEGAYGANVNSLIGGGNWNDENEISQTYSNRKGFAYGRNGKATQQAALLQSVIEHVDFAYQNLDSVELGVTSISHYFDSLGGMGRSATKARGGRVTPIYISDQTRGEGKVRSLNEQVALETRTRVLNPKWYEGMLKHGYEGVRQIEEHVTNTVGWSATTGQVDPWVYEQITRTYVLDPEMRQRLAELNPVASAKMANRIIEAHQRGYWKPDDATLAALQNAGDELEDRLEGVATEIAA